MATPDNSPHFDDVLGDALLPFALAHLPLEDLCRLPRVCRRLRRAVLEAQPVWRQLYAATWPDSQASGGSVGRQEQEQPTQRQAEKQQQQQHSLNQRHQQGQEQQQQREGSASIPTTHGKSWPPSSTSPAGASSSRQQAGAGSVSGVHTLVTDFAGSSGGQSSSGHKRKRGESGQGTAGADSPTLLGSSREGVDWRERFKVRFVEAAQRERLKRLARRHKAESALQVFRQEVHRLEQDLAQEQRTLPALQAELAAVQRARQQASTAALAQTYWQPHLVATAHGVLTDQAPQDQEGREHDLKQRVAVSQLEICKLQMALGAKRRRAAEAQRKLQALLP